LLEVGVLPGHLRYFFLREPGCLRVTALQLFKIRPVRLFHLLSARALSLLVIGSHGLPTDDPQKHRSVDQDHHPDAAKNSRDRPRDRPAPSIGTDSHPPENGEGHDTPEAHYSPCPRRTFRRIVTLAVLGWVAEIGRAHV